MYRDYLNFIYKKISFIYNYILDENGIDADKYEREDAYFGLLMDIGRDGKDPIRSFKKVFELVHDIELTEKYIGFTIANCLGPNDIWEWKKVTGKGKEFNKEAWSFLSSSNE